MPAPAPSVAIRSTSAKPAFSATWADPRHQADRADQLADRREDRVVEEVVALAGSATATWLGQQRRDLVLAVLGGRRPYQ